MTHDEIVKALKLCAGDRCCEGCIEEQSVRHWQIVMREAADLIESLQANLAASQRREKSAVEDARQGSVCRTCHYLNNGCEPLNLDAGCHKWQWRGPQEAGEGEAE